MELATRIAPIYGEPFADSSAIPTLLVSEMARKNAVVALSGDGGDELFMGYHNYKWAQFLGKRTVSKTGPYLRPLLELGGTQWKRRAEYLDTSKSTLLKTHIFSLTEKMFSEVEVMMLTGRVFRASDLKRPELGNSRVLSPMEEHSFIDIGTYLKDDLLVKVDRASMYHSLEVRVPMLDHRLVEYALNVHHNLKLNGSELKHILKELLYDYLPKNIFDRPKWGFAIPMVNWLQTELYYLIEKYLSEENIKELGMVDYNVVLEIKNRFDAGETELYSKLWNLIQLHQWHKEVHLA